MANTIRQLSGSDESVIDVEESSVAPWVHFSMFKNELAMLGLGIDNGELFYLDPNDGVGAEGAEAFGVMVQAGGFLNRHRLQAHARLGGQYTNKIPGELNSGRTRVGIRVPAVMFTSPV